MEMEFILVSYVECFSVFKLVVIVNISGSLSSLSSAQVAYSERPQRNCKLALPVQLQADTVRDQLVNTVKHLAAKEPNTLSGVGEDQHRAKRRVNIRLLFRWSDI